MVSGPGTITGGNNLTFTAAGTVLVVASQGGNATYNPAPAVTNVVVVERIDQTITFPAIPDQTVTSQVGLTAAASSGLPVSFTVVSGPGTITGGNNLTFTSAGTVLVVASQAGNEIYYPAPTVTNVASVMFVDNDGRGTIQFSSSSYNVNEDAGIVTILATRIGGSSGPASVDYATADGMASAGQDYTSHSGALSWPDGDASSKTITVTITDDSLDENNETFTVTLSNATGARLGLPSSTTVTLVDNDNPPAGEIRLAETNIVVNEDVVNIELKIIRTNGNYGVVSVDYTNKGVTASAGVDYGVVTGQLTWVDGDVSDKVITIPVIDDTADESDEVFEIVLTNAVGTSIAGTNVASVTIVDNDYPPAGVLQFAAASAQVAEDGGSVILSVMRTGGSYGPATVAYATAAGTATAGLDYETVQGTLSWSDADNSGKTIAVPITDDSIDESDETFTLTLGNAQGASLGSPNVATVTVLDNDLPPQPGTVQFRSSSYGVNEDAGTLALTVTRTSGSDGPVNVEYTTKAETAVVGFDYEFARDKLSWANGDSSDRIIKIAITDDNVDETDETFSVVLENIFIDGAVLGSPSSATVTIIDNDEPANDEPGQADLEASSFKFEPGNLWAGDHPAEIEFDLVNGGPADIDAQGARLEIAFYLSANQALGDGDDIAIGTKTETITLPAGSQAAIRYPGRAHNTDVTIPEELAGDFYVFVSVWLGSSSGLTDPDGAVAMREGPIRVRIHPADDGNDDGEDDGNGNDGSKRRSVVNDYDGDEQTDMMVYNEGSGEWTIKLSSIGEVAQFVFGGPGYELVSGDYDGDGLTDPAIHQRSGLAWSILLSSRGYEGIDFNFGGLSATRGTVGDYTGNGSANPGLYEEASGRWYVLWLNEESGNLEIASAVFGGSGYLPVAGDYDGDGRTDPAVYGAATGHWMVMLSAQGYGVVSGIFGGPRHTPVVGDYDGDGRADPMLYEQATGTWQALMSANGYALKRFSSSAGIPVAGDFDGDGVADPAVLSGSAGWSFLSSASAYLRFGPYSFTSP
ncbi:MAG: hypothetical protein HYV35_05455 [Lentisphaerae bacterium]|nr:hypothetical protein [Lentisphaerota bacterium]